MAKISAHGTAIGTIHYSASSKMYMSDGKVLKNNGHGWKLYSTVKPHLTPTEAYNRAVANRAAKLAERPHLAAWTKALIEAAPLSKRWKLKLAISMMPQDPDGVWSEVCDGYGDNVHLDVDEVAELCRLYLLAEVEFNSLKQAA